MAVYCLDDLVAALHEKGDKYVDSKEEQVVKAMQELAKEGFVQLPSKNVAKRLIAQKTGLSETDSGNALEVLVVLELVTKKGVRGSQGTLYTFSTFIEAARREW